MKKLALCLILIGCTNTAPNHLGNPVLWPVQAITTGMYNAVYNARRKKVSAFVSNHFTEIKHDSEMGGGPTLIEAMTISNVPMYTRPKLISELQKNPDIYFTTNQEPLIVALMVYGD